MCCCCCRGQERWIKTLQGRVKFVAVSFSIVSVFGLCILFVLYFADLLPIATSQLIGKVIYVIMTVCLNILLYQGARFRNEMYLTIWLVAVMIQNVVTFGYGIFAIYLCTISSSSELITLPVLCFAFGILHFLIWCVALKFKRQVASEKEIRLDIQNHEIDKPFKDEEIL